MFKDKQRFLFYDNTLIINNYKELISISNNKIEVKNYEITGKDLQILELDGYLIKIKGEILTIRLLWDTMKLN